MKVKEGAQAHPVHPRIHYVRGVVDAVFLMRAGREAVLTSSLRPNRPGGSSLHDSGLADDYRTRDLDVKLQREIAEAVAEILGPDFDVILEGEAAFHDRYRDSPPHLHVELDPDPVT